MSRMDTVLAAFVPLIDSAVLIAASRLGFAQSQDIRLELRREPSWASLRDHLELGHVDCAHTLAPLPIAAALGLGRAPAPLSVPFVLGRGGNAITLSTELALAVAAEREAGPTRDAPPRGTRIGIAVGGGVGAAARALAHVVKSRGSTPTFGVVHPFSGHHYELRYWLAAGGLDPDRDVRIVAIPPPSMVRALVHREVDGFCVGEPWNSVAVAEDLGRIVATKRQMFPHGVEKVLAVRPALAADSDLLGRLLRALDAAARWCDAPEHVSALAALLAEPEHVGVEHDVLERSLRGAACARDVPAHAHADAETDTDALFEFHRHGANLPRQVDALWLYAQMVRWGQTAFSPAAALCAASVYRPDIYQAALAPEHPLPPTPTLRAFDGVPFDPTALEHYLARFAADGRDLRR